MQQRPKSINQKFALLVLFYDIHFRTTSPKNCPKAPLASINIKFEGESAPKKKTLFFAQQKCAPKKQTIR